MKAFFFIVAVLLLTSSVKSQKLSSSGEYYLVKSKKESRRAVIMLGTGTAAVVTGLVLVNRTEPGWETVNWNSALGGSALLILGSAMMAGSIVLFSKSAHDRKKGNALTLQLNKPVPINTGLQKTVLPHSIGISIALR